MNDTIHHDTIGGISTPPNNDKKRGQRLKSVNKRTSEQFTDLS